MKKILLFYSVILLALFLRFYNTNWDSGFHLHPDERFLTMIGITEKTPTSFSQYFDTKTSPLNPNNLGFSFFVYGTFPLTLNFLFSLILHTQNYFDFTLQGRVLSAFFDSLTCLVVYAIARLLRQKYDLPYSFPLCSLFIYSIAVLPIQLSHFYTVDMFANFFIITSVYFSMRFFFSGKTYYIVASAIFFGLAVASKVSVLIAFPLLFIFFFLPHTKHYQNQPFLTLRSLLFFILKLFLFLFISYFTIRITDPYMFQSSNILIPQLDITFLQSIKILQSEYSPTTSFPPAFQWINKIPLIFSVKNIFLFGFGIPSSLLLLSGMWIAVWKKKLPVLRMLSLWLISMFYIEGMQFAQTMRYFIYFYPFFSLFAGIGLSFLIKKKSFIIVLIILCLLCIWPLSFFSIYLSSNTRVLASKWINTHVPSNSTILTEYWDDSLPLFASPGKKFNSIPLQVFAPDTPLKWSNLQKELASGNYLVLSSNRGWETIENLPEKFPKMSQWYKDLFAGKLPYKKIAEFKQYPTLSYLGIPITISDAFSEEAFTVFDHPTVFIFQQK